MKTIINNVKTGVLGSFDKFIKTESAGSIIMIIAMFLAIIAANSPLSGAYSSFWQTKAGFTLGDFSLHKPLVLWVNDGLMAVFFLLVGLEVKREFISGELSSVSKAALPAVGAVGGAVLPALIYIFINRSGDISGWGVPMATDIAFAVGLLSLIGRKLPSGLKVFLTSLAVVDDILAVIVIALFYTDSIVTAYLYYAAALTVILLALNRAKVLIVSPYLIIGALVWYCLLKAGVHATAAGVVTAMFIPASKNGTSPLEKLENSIHGFTAYIIMPVFVLANMGIPLVVSSIGSAAATQAAGAAIGLIIGKPAGIILSVWFSLRMGWVSLPDNVGMKHIAGAGMLAGIGLTMSIFIASMAYSPVMLDTIKLAVLSASVISALSGMLWLSKISK